MNFGKMILTLLFLMLAVAACGTNVVSPSEITTAVAINTPILPTDTPQPTATAVATETPLPTHTPEPQSMIFISFYGGPPSGQWDRDNYDAFLANNPHIDGRHIGYTLYSSPVPKNIHNFITETRTPPDVMTGYIVGNMRPYIEQGYIADISDLWAEQGWYEQFPQSVIDLVSVDGKQYFVPQAIQWNPIWYRTDIFAEVGLTPPATWAELLTACDTLHEAGYIPIAVSSLQWTPPLARWFTIINMRLNGPAFHERLMLGQERYDDPRVREVFVLWREMFEHNCFAPDRYAYGSAANQIYNGQAAMYNLGEWLAESYSDGMPDTFDFFSPPPITPDVPRGEIVHMYGGFMLTQAQNREAARAFLAYLGNAPSQEDRRAALNQVVMNLTADQSDHTAVYQNGITFVAEADHMTQLYELNTHPDVAEEGLKVFERFFADPDRDLDDLLADWEVERQNAYGDGS